MMVALELNCLGLSHLLHPLNVYDLGRVVFIFLYHHFFINENNNNIYLIVIKIIDSAFSWKTAITIRA